MVLSITSGDLASGEGLTFGSLTFVADGVGRFDINPPSFFPDRTIFFGSLTFVIDRYGDLRLRVPPPQRGAGVIPSEPVSPTPPASDLEDDYLPSTNLAAEARILASRSECCIDLTTTHQPTLVRIWTPWCATTASTTASPKIALGTAMSQTAT